MSEASSPAPTEGSAAPSQSSAVNGSAVHSQAVHSPATRDRLIAAILLVACLALLGVAAGLTPDERGYGTHERLNLPPCGFKAGTGLPCATCGMTTSFSHAANGELFTAFTVQPAGTVLALGTAMMAVLAALSLVFGFSLAPLGRLLGRPVTVVALGVLILAGWTYTLAVAVGF